MQWIISKASKETDISFNCKKYDAHSKEVNLIWPMSCIKQAIKGIKKIVT